MWLKNNQTSMLFNIQLYNNLHRFKIFSFIYSIVSLLSFLFYNDIIKDQIFESKTI
jgi:hypothetical protein